MSKENNVSRRKFLKAAGITGGAIIVGSGVIASTVATSYAAPKSEMKHAPVEVFKGKMFFTNELEFLTLTHACERIFPKDKNGPGAMELDVPFFIDNQLAGAYGYNAREYTKGPFFKGIAAQGYQTPLLKRDIFRTGLIAMNYEANFKFKKDFPDLTDVQKDEILKAFESGSVTLVGVTSDYFFSLLKGATLAGAYADPIYNGNKNMDGWKMKNFPGAQMTYSDIIESKKFDVIPPISLASMQQM